MIILFGGILSEDGVDQIKLGDGLGRSCQDSQRFLFMLYYHGVILTICSKNDESDVLRMFREHSGMILKEEYIAFHLKHEEKMTLIIRYIYKKLSEMYDNKDVDEIIRRLLSFEFSFDNIKNIELFLLYVINKAQQLCKNDTNPCLKSSIIIFVIMFKLGKNPILYIGLVDTSNGIKAHAYVTNDQYEVLYDNFVLVKKYTFEDFEVV